MEYLMLSVASLLLGVNFTLNKIYQNHNGTGIRSVLFFNTCFGLVNAVMFFSAQRLYASSDVVFCCHGDHPQSAHHVLYRHRLRSSAPRDTGDIYAVSDERRDDPPVSLGASFSW